MNTLQKFLQQSGFGNRRIIRQMITEGKIKVNQKVITDPGFPLDPIKDRLRFKNKELKLRIENRRYIVLYKPSGVVSTLADPQRRPTVRDYMGKIKERLYPVGRLDFHSEGLMLLTNDGELANFIISAKNKVPKVYMVKIKGTLEERETNKLEKGIFLEGERLNPFQIEPVKTTPQGNSWVKVTITEGKKHILRKAFQFCGHPVEKLKRIAIGTILLKNLKPGQWRELSAGELDLFSRKFRFAEKTRRN